MSQWGSNIDDIPEKLKNRLTESEKATLVDQSLQIRANIDFVNSLKRRFDETLQEYVDNH